MYPWQNLISLNTNYDVVLRLCQCPYLRVSAHFTAVRLAQIATLKRRSLLAKQLIPFE